MSFRVETDRLLIRPWQPDERPVFERFVTDGEMIRYISHGRVWDKARVDAYFERQSRYLTEHGCCLGAAMLKENNEIIGSGGIQPLENAGVFEFGWSIWKDYWNQGLATEMALSLKEYAFKVLKLPLFVAIVDPPNRASIRVAEKLGMRYEGIRNAHELANRYPELEVAYYILEN